jgi:hypothetical protein
MAGEGREGGREGERGRERERRWVWSERGVRYKFVGVRRLTCE